MTLDEATTALAANSAALYFAGRDADMIISALLQTPVPSSFGVRTVEELNFYQDKQMIQVFRDSLVDVDQPTLLMLTTNFISSTAGLIADRNKGKTDEIAAAAQAEADRKRSIGDRNRQRELAEKAWRATHPAFAALKSRIMAGEMAISQATSPSDFAAAEQILADAFQAATTSIALGVASVLPSRNDAQSKAA